MKKDVSIIVGGRKGIGRAIYLNLKKKTRKFLWYQDLKSPMIIYL